MNDPLLLPLSPLLYEFGNSLISSLVLCVVAVLGWFFATEVYQLGFRIAYCRLRFKLGLSITAIVAGDGAYRAWTWWGRHCANTDNGCYWMFAAAWQTVPAVSIALEVGGLLCMIRVLIPDAWGTRAWLVSAALALSWSLFWFSGWGELGTALFGSF
jgi:hypothetical protein